jgi:hypothetical protein
MVWWYLAEELVPRVRLPPEGVYPLNEEEGRGVEAVKGRVEVRDCIFAMGECFLCLMT